MSEPSKLLVFRVPVSLKTDFRIAIMRQETDVQHTLEAFIEAFISYDKGEKLPDSLMKAIVQRSKFLTGGA